MSKDETMISCHHPGECFARGEDRYTSKGKQPGGCTILNGIPVVCRFQKPSREITNGVLYPYVKPTGGDYSV